MRSIRHIWLLAVAFLCAPASGIDCHAFLRPSPSTIVMRSVREMVPTLWLCVSAMDARLAFGRYSECI